MKKHSITVFYDDKIGDVRTAKFYFDYDPEKDPNGKPIFSMAAAWGNHGFWLTGGTIFIPPYKIHELLVLLDDPA